MGCSNLPVNHWQSFTAARIACESEARSRPACRDGCITALLASSSEISQMLGNEIKYTVREPFGIRLWILISAVTFSVMALVALLFPNQLYEVVFEEELSTTNISIRLYGGALLSLSLVIWNGVYTTEMVIIRWTLLTEACYFAIQFLVTFITLAELGVMPNTAVLLLLSRLLFLMVTLAYYYHLGRRNKKM
ncbi:unnamed protein product [Boreogadus saida]